MSLFRRPAAPTEFSAPEGPIAEARSRIAREVGAGRTPSFGDLWGDYKPLLAGAQHGICAYCNEYILGTQVGDVDHVAPKGTVERLIEPGNERENASNVEGRRTPSYQVGGADVSGYWWLAYDWSNYVLACERCNRVWKRALFPVAEGDQRPLPPHQGGLETPLLLNPYAEDPSHHYRFTEFGEILSLTPQGQATIEVCGLNRPSLTVARMQEASATAVMLEELEQLEASGQEELIEAQLDKLLGRCAAERRFSVVNLAMVRWLLAQAEEAQPGPATHE